jgi:hypothetical protein
MKHMERVLNVRDEFHLTIIIKFYSDGKAMVNRHNCLNDI